MNIPYKIERNNRALLSGPVFRFPEEYALLELVMIGEMPNFEKEIKCMLNHAKMNSDIQHSFVGNLVRIGIFEDKLEIESLFEHEQKRLKMKLSDFIYLLDEYKKLNERHEDE